MDSDNNMASALKRKRASMEIGETPKRAKSTKAKSTESIFKLSEVSGWNAAFNPPAPGFASSTNTMNGIEIQDARAKSPQAVRFEDYVEDSQSSAADDQQALVGKRSKQLATDEELRSSQTVGRAPQKSSQPERSLEKKLAKKKADLWKISEPIGGRLINVDPVFTQDERFLIVANRTTIQVYSTSNSLLTRSIKLRLTSSVTSPPRIIAFALSPSQENILWVACSDANIFRIDWTTGAGAEQSWGVSSSGCVHMTVASMESAGRRRDVVFTTEIRKDGGFRVTANELAIPDSGIANAARTIYTSNERINFLKSDKEGGVIVGSSGKKILVGRLRSTEYSTIDKIRYEFRVFESSDPIKSLDIRVAGRSFSEGAGLKKASKKMPVVDVVVGDVKGVIYVHNDLFMKLFSEGIAQTGLSLMPRKLHWHRQAVHTVKWSQDGNYVISGGTETVLVLWQLDTGKHQFLPHMSATIQNVVVSPTGSSYAVQLADNSAMVLSTAELQPTANISGIQISVIESEVPLESQVRMVRDTKWSKPLVQRTPAVVSPSRPSRLLLGVGHVQTIDPSRPQRMSNPYLETFDLGAGHNVSRQALARTSATNVDATPSTYRITEPRVTHIKISHDGQWLATVDEWTPPAAEFEHLTHSNKALSEEQRHRREVFLKFWQWNNELSNWELSSRVNSPHAAGEDLADAGRIFDLAVDPTSLRFATIGEDGLVRTWTPRTRKRDGIVVRDQENRPLRNWDCENAILLSKLELLDTNTVDTVPKTGLLAFSSDGSLLAAACSSEDGLVHLISPETGSIRTSHTGLFDEEIFGLQILGQDLIVVSENLLVFDLVAQELRYGTTLKSITSLSIEQKQEMIHLAIDERSQTFALALPKFVDPIVTYLESDRTSEIPKSPKSSLLQASSDLFVFSQDNVFPQLHQAFSSIVSALIPVVGTQGYLVLDTAAEIHTVGKKGAQAITNLAQSTSALQLDSIPEQAAADLMELVEAKDVEVKMDDDESEADEAELETKNEDEVKEEENDEHQAAAVSQQQLAQIFDIGPAFALPPMEEMFYQVAALFISKPFVANAG